jgi:Protein of unknown function (DUF1838)
MDSSSPAASSNFMPPTFEREHTPRRALLLAIALACAACGQRPRVASSHPSPVDEIVRIRCALDGSEVTTTWTGTAYSFVPGERQQRLFDVVGMNVARCLRAGDRWHLTSRELMYYVDPVTHRPLDRWTNPWTGETVPVMHVANAIVQMELGAAPIIRAGRSAIVAIDVPLFYPNRLATNEAARSFSPETAYQAGEFFSLTADAAAAKDVGRVSVPEMTLSWFRISPWLPWMNMGDRNGRLVVSARGNKVRASELPELLRREIAERLPLYQHAPACLVDAPNESSWSYFAAHLDAYETNARFPIAAPARAEICRASR